MLQQEHPAKSLLLISSSNVYAQGYLDHVEKEILDFLGDTHRIAFIPFALYEREAYFAKVPDTDLASETRANAIASKQ